MDNQLSGLLLVDKPCGISSAAVLSRIKRQIPAFRHKIGHAGTLDPFASGLLVVLIGRATRLVPYVHDGWKEYTGTIRLGRRTDSDDITGVLVAENPAPLLSAQECEELVTEFQGEIQQVPPKISAVKVAGQRAYDLARDGKNFELTAKTVHIHAYDLAPTEQLGILSFRVRSSGGTYIRSLARDLGEKIGVGACLESLRRTEVQPFRVEEAKLLEDLVETDLRPWEDVCTDAARLWLPESDALGLWQGKQHILRSKDFQKAADEAHASHTQARAGFLLYGNARTQHLSGVLRRSAAGDWELAVNIQEEKLFSSIVQEDICHHSQS